jgi:hypothetical protein
LIQKSLFDIAEASGTGKTTNKRRRQRHKINKPPLPCIWSDTIIQQFAIFLTSPLFSHFYTTFKGGAINRHCKEISIYLFPEKELHGLSPNFHFHVSVSDLYIFVWSTYFPAAE